MPASLPSIETKLPISVLIPAKNEISNIEECIRSVAFADEVVVVDSQSTDGSDRIAAALGAQVVQFHWDGSFPRKKNWALENVPWRNEWVLILDADERITPALEAEIRQALDSPDCDGYYLNRRFWFMGGWIHHCGYFPSWNLRLFRHRLGRYERLEIASGGQSGDNEVHEHVLLEGPTRYLAEPMLHYAFPNLDVWIEKHNRYSAWEARVVSALHDEAGHRTLKSSPFGTNLEKKRWLKKLARSVPGRPLLRFGYHYILKQGFRDGYRGWVLSWLLAWYEFVSSAKAWENASGGGS